MSNFIPNKIIICDDRHHHWINRHIENLIPYSDNLYKTFVHGKNIVVHLLAFNNYFTKPIKSVYSES